MALLKCPECKKKFSDTASACPSCGAPVKLAIEANEKTKKDAKKGYVIIFAVVIAVMIFGSRDKDPAASTPASTEAPAKPDPELTEIKLQRLARGFVESALKDPNSAEFRNQNGVCGQVNANNSFGGKTGFRRFVAVSNDLVVIDGEVLRGSEFQKVWDQACK